MKLAQYAINLISYKLNNLFQQVLIFCKDDFARKMNATITCHNTHI